MTLLSALIYKSTGSWYITKTAEGKQYNARTKGVLKISGLTSTNPIAVGDEVEMELENELEKELEKELKDALLLRVLPSELGAELLSELASELLTL